MPWETRPPRLLRFGVFDLNLSARELRKHGVRIKLRGHAAEVLEFLLERPGEIVTRERIQERLWPGNTFVDFEHGLNTAVKKLRAALGDSPENSRYIETVPKVGYRFIAPVEELAGPKERPQEPLTDLSATAGGVPPIADPHEIQQGRWARRRGLLWAVILGTGVAIALMAAGSRAAAWLFPPAPNVLTTTQLTHSGRVDAWGRITSDGSRLFYLEREADHWNLMQISPAGGGESQPFPAPFRNTRILAVSPDRSELLIGEFTARSERLPVWVMPAIGGAPRRLGDVVAMDAVFTPDGKRVTYSQRDGLYETQRDGSHAQKLVSLPGPAEDLAWSPDGERLRFTMEVPDLEARAIWEVDARGRGLHRVFSADGGECCGRWTGDGRYFVFDACRSGVCGIWVRHEARLRFLAPANPSLLMAGPVPIEEPWPETNGHRIFVKGGGERLELLRFDAKTRSFQILGSGTNVRGGKISPDGKWLAYVTDQGLWRSRLDGSERVLLTPNSPDVWYPRWSHDAKRIAYEGRTPDGRKAIFVMDSAGGTPRLAAALLKGSAGGVPDWAPDGNSIAFGIEPDSANSASRENGIYISTLEAPQGTPSLQRLAGSEGLNNPRWSPDGKHLAARSEDRKQLLLFDLQTRQWKQIAQGKLLMPAEWSHDGSYLYFQDILAPGQPLLRIRTGTEKPEMAMDFRSVLGAGAARCGFEGLTPDDAPIVLITRSGGDLFALDVHFP